MIKAFRWFLFSFLHRSRVCYWHGEKTFQPDWGGGDFYCGECESDRKLVQQVEDTLFSAKARRLRPDKENQEILNDTLTRCQAECTRLLEENRKLEALFKRTRSYTPALCQCAACRDICAEFASGDPSANPQS